MIVKHLDGFDYQQNQLINELNEAIPSQNYVFLYINVSNFLSKMQ